MSGHSKWSQIKRQKGVADQKRGKVFTKIANAITLAVKQGGGVTDPSQNFKLRLAVDSAKTSNMPKENIDRAIKRASGSKEGSLDEVIYEGFAPEGISVIIEAATDNSARTTAEIKSFFNKMGGSFGQPGSTAYLFRQTGQIIVKKDSKTFDEIFSVAAEGGADDVEDLGEEVYVYVAVNNLSKLREFLGHAGLNIVESEIVRIPLNTMKIEDKDKLEKVTNFLSGIEDMDDVQKIYSNLEF